MKQITIYDLLPLLKKGFVAMDEDRSWWWFEKKPRIEDNEWWNVSGILIGLSRFNIAPFDGDWKDSLIKCGESAIIKKHKDEE